MQTAGTINNPDNPVDWTKLRNVPGGLADGVDDAGGAGDGHSLDAADGDPVDVVFVNDAGRVGIGSASFTVAELEVVTDSDNAIFGSSNTANGVYGYSAAGTGVRGATSTGKAGTFVGAEAGYGTTVGYANTFVGARAGRSNTDAEWNTFMGAGASQSLSSGWANTMVGAFAGTDQSSGSGNTYIGSHAGFDNHSGGECLHRQLRRLSCAGVRQVPHSQWF